MINLNEPEPPLEERRCAECSRPAAEASLEGVLIHWPHEAALAPVKLGWTLEQEPFSIWIYTCRWCRGKATRRKGRVAGKGGGAVSEATGL